MTGLMRDRGLDFHNLSVVSGQWSVVSGQWSVVSGQWSVVSGQWSVVSWNKMSRVASVEISFSETSPELARAESPAQQDPHS
jgi:hypothetical protein